MRFVKKSMLMAGFLRFSFSCSDVSGLGREGDLEDDFVDAKGVKVFVRLKFRS